MENAVDALKIAFAVLIFSMAVALAFTLIGQARTTSEIVLSLNDKTADLEYISENEVNASNKERIVTFGTILPAIYRYAEEQYAVTIYKNDGTPIARFDLWTEGFMGNWDQVLKNSKSNNLAVREDANQTINNIQERLNNVQKIVNGQNFDITWLDELYKVSSNNNSNIRHGAPWVGDSNEIIKRINADIDTNINRAKYSKNGITYFGKKLDSYKNTTFIEKFVEIQTSGETIIETDDKGNIEYSLETIKGNKKLEIVYIMQ